MIETDIFSKKNNYVDDVASRRLFLKGLLVGAAVSATGFSGIAKATAGKLQLPRKLAFYNLHTEEKVSMTYFEEGQYVKGAVQELNYLLRDHRSGDVYNMDPELYDLLYDLQSSLGGNKTFQVISGFRSASTNAMLNQKSRGVATKSLHMQGKAIDIRVEGVDSKVLQQASIALQKGGVGYYHKSDFVHIDTGNVRYW